MKKTILCSLLAVTLLMGLCVSVSVEAADKYVSSVAWDTPRKANGSTFVAKQHQVGSRYLSKIIRKKNGKSTTLVSGVDAAFVTNGKVLYYSKPTKQINDYSWKNTIYCYDIKTKKSRKIVSGTDYTVRGCSGKYLYCGKDMEADGVKLYAVNVKTKKKKHMVDCVRDVTIYKGKVLTTTNTGAVDNLPIHVFDLNGSGKKKIADGCNAVIKSGKVYYTRYSMKTNKFRVYRCSLNGKNKKAVTGWLDRVPSKYL